MAAISKSWFFSKAQEIEESEPLKRELFYLFNEPSLVFILFQLLSPPLHIERVSHFLNSPDTPISKMAQKTALAKDSAIRGEIRNSIKGFKRDLRKLFQWMVGPEGKYCVIESRIKGINCDDENLSLEKIVFVLPTHRHKEYLKQLFILISAEDNRIAFQSGANFTEKNFFVLITKKAKSPHLQSLNALIGLNSTYSVDLNVLEMAHKHLASQIISDPKTSDQSIKQLTFYGDLKEDSEFESDPEFVITHDSEYPGWWTPEERKWRELQEEKQQQAATAENLPFCVLL